MPWPFLILAGAAKAAAHAASGSVVTKLAAGATKAHVMRYLDLYLQGRLKLDEMISRRGKLEDVNEAVRAMKAGEVARTVLMFQ